MDTRLDWESPILVTRWRQVLLVTLPAVAPIRWRIRAIGWGLLAEPLIIHVPTRLVAAAIPLLAGVGLYVIHPLLGLVLLPFLLPLSMSAREAAPAREVASP